MIVDRPIFSQREEVNLRRRQDLTPSQWAEGNRVLPPGLTAIPGSWSNLVTPYLVGPMDAICEEGVEEVVMLKPVQVGFSEAVRNVIGYWIDNDPGPCLIVMPSDKSGRETIDERIRPLLEHSPALKRHLSDRTSDNTLGVIKLDTMHLYLATAGSPQSLASRPCRYVVFDEIDKYPPFAGREADPISLGTERTATYDYRRRLIKGSTPTTRQGPIWKAWEACGDRRYFNVPCPHCGQFQRLTWPNVKWPKSEEPDKVKRADDIEGGKLAWYECERCHEKIVESQRLPMVAKGKWVSEGQIVDLDGNIRGNRPKSKRVGFHISCLYSRWRTFSQAAAEFIRCAGDPGLTMNFRNSWLAEPFEVQVSKTEPGLFRDRAVGAPKPKVIPKWAKVIIATADTQKDHFYYIVRAWGHEYRSQKIDEGIVSTFEELRTYSLDAQYELETTGTASSQLLLIDSGGGKNADTGTTRTSEVYQFAQSDPGRIKPLKGASGRLNWPVDKSMQKEKGLVLWIIDTFQCETLLDRLIHDPDRTRWMLNSVTSDAYCQQLASKHLIVEPQTKELKWVKKTAGAADHFRDCEIYQCAAAWDVGCGTPEPATPASEKPKDDDKDAPPAWQIKAW